MFRFFHLPITSEADVTRNFEQLQTLLAGQLLEEYLSAGVQAKLNPGAWTSPTGFSSKLEETASVQARAEQGKTSVRLKGLAKAKEAIPAKTTLFTLPAGLRPPVEVRVLAIDATAGTALYLAVSAAGVVSAPGTEITAAHFIGFDGITFHLT